MIEILFFLLSFLAFLDALFDKWGIWSTIQEKSEKSTIDFIYRLGSCHFCLMFHLAWIVSIPIVAFFSHISVFILPFSAIGLFKLIEKVKYDL